MLPEIKKKLEEDDNKDLILLMYGLTSGQITDKNLLTKVLDKTIDQFRKDKTVNLSDDQLILGVQGLSKFNFTILKYQHYHSISYHIILFLVLRICTLKSALSENFCILNCKKLHNYFRSTSIQIS